MRRRLKVVLCLSILITSQHIAAFAEKSPWQDMAVVGQGKLRFAIWDVYEAILLSPSGRYQPSEPFALKLTYLRDFKKKHLLKETRKQLQLIDQKDTTEQDSWIAALDKIWVDVKKYDSITLVVNDKGSSSFFLNETFLGQVEDPKFSQGFASIWLSEKTSRPGLRKKLLGEK